MASSLTYRRLRAPRHDGGLLIDPDWSMCLELAEKNAFRMSRVDFDLLGHSFQSLRSAARADFLRLAVDYTSRYAEADASLEPSRTPLFVSGHQPQLFHPGVWAKTFATDTLARQASGVALHILVDSDLCRDHTVRIPSGDATRPYVVSEPYDQFDTPVPFELRKVRDSTIFESFAQRVTTRLARLIPDPLVQDLWPDAVQAVRAGRPVGLALAQARHRLERAWGLRTLEVPLSALSETQTFRWFLLHMLLHAEQVRESHNRHLEQYRRLHRLRNAAQPVPDLRQSEGWTESPFWLWTSQDPRRRALWSRRDGKDLLISDRQSPGWVVEAPSLGDAAQAVKGLAESRRAGLSIRPRALSNTLFARLFLGDLFMHGIGGAKYDQITDLWMADLFSVDPPPYATLSLTLHLPIRHRSVPPSASIEARQRLREMQFHPERFLSQEEAGKNQVSHWVRAKSQYIQHLPPRGHRRERHRGIVESNAKLRHFLQGKCKKQEQQLADLGRQLAACRVLESREWSFCLFPAKFLRDRLLELGGSSP